MNIDKQLEKRQKGGEEKGDSGKAEDAGGLTPTKDDNAVMAAFNRRTLAVFKLFVYNIGSTPQP